MKLNYVKILGYLQLFVGVSAVAGGLPMIIQPNGSQQSISAEVLKGSPFSTLLIPGILLVFVIGILHLVGSFFSLNNKKHHSILSIFLGVMLIGWIVVQLYLIGFGSLLQPLYLALGTLELILALLVFRLK